MMAALWEVGWVGAGDGEEVTNGVSVDSDEGSGGVEVMLIELEVVVGTGELVANASGALVTTEGATCGEIG